MNYKNILAVVLLVIVVGLFSIIQQKPWLAGATVESVSSGSFSTSTYYASISTQGMSGVILLKGVTDASIGNGRVSGVLESVVITGAPKSGTVQFYNATTSDINRRLGNKATTSILLAEFPANMSTSTELNVAFDTGLLMVTTGTPSTSTVTWK